MVLRNQRNTFFSLARLPFMWQFLGLPRQFLDLFRPLSENLRNWFGGSRIRWCCSIGKGGTGRSALLPFKPQQLIAATTCVTLLEIFLKMFEFFICCFLASLGPRETGSIVGPQFSTLNQDLKMISLTLSNKIWTRYLI